MNGGYYTKGRDGMWLIVETMQKMLYDSYKKDEQLHNPGHLLYQDHLVFEDGITKALGKLEFDDTEGFTVEFDHVKLLQEDIM